MNNIIGICIYCKREIDLSNKGGIYGKFIQYHRICYRQFIYKKFIEESSANSKEVQELINELGEELIKDILEKI